MAYSAALERKKSFKAIRNSKKDYYSVGSRDDSDHLPTFFFNCVSFLEENALEVEGITRIHGRAQDTNAIESHLSTGNTKEKRNTTLAQVDPHAVATLLKSYLNHGPPLLPLEHYLTLVEIGSKNELDGNTVFALRDIIASTPISHQRVLHRVLIFIDNVQQNSSKNKMDYRALAIIFSPILLRAPTEVSPAQILSQNQACLNCTFALLKNYQEIFLGIGLDSTEIPISPSQPSRDSITLQALNTASASLANTKDKVKVRFIFSFSVKTGGGIPDTVSLFLKWTKQGAKVARRESGQTSALVCTNPQEVEWDDAIPMEVTLGLGKRSKVFEPRNLFVTLKSVVQKGSKPLASASINLAELAPPTLQASPRDEVKSYEMKVVKSKGMTLVVKSSCEWRKVNGKLVISQDAATPNVGRGEERHRTMRRLTKTPQSMLSLPVKQPEEDEDEREQAKHPLSARESYGDQSTPEISVPASPTAVSTPSPTTLVPIPPPTPLMLSPRENDVIPDTNIPSTDVALAINSPRSREPSPRGAPAISPRGAPAISPRPAIIRTPTPPPSISPSPSPAFSPSSSPPIVSLLSTNPASAQDLPNTESVPYNITSTNTTDSNNNTPRTLETVPSPKSDVEHTTGNDTDTKDTKESDKESDKESPKANSTAKTTLKDSDSSDPSDSTDQYGKSNGGPEISTPHSDKKEKKVNVTDLAVPRNDIPSAPVSPTSSKDYDAYISDGESDNDYDVHNVYTLKLLEQIENLKQQRRQLELETFNLRKCLVHNEIYRPQNLEFSERGIASTAEQIIENLVKMNCFQEPQNFLPAFFDSIIISLQQESKNEVGLPNILYWLSTTLGLLYLLCMSVRGIPDPSVLGVAALTQPIKVELDGSDDYERTNANLLQFARGVQQTGLELYNRILKIFVEQLDDEKLVLAFLGRPKEKEEKRNFVIKEKQHDVTSRTPEPVLTPAMALKEITREIGENIQLLKDAKIFDVFLWQMELHRMFCVDYLLVTEISTQKKLYTTDAQTIKQATAEVEQLLRDTFSGKQIATPMKITTQYVALVTAEYSKLDSETFISNSFTHIKPSQILQILEVLRPDKDSRKPVPGSVMKLLQTMAKNEPEKQRVVPMTWHLSDELTKLRQLVA